MIPLQSSSTRHRRRTCDHRGCGKSTRLDKPYCTDHVQEHPYVRKLTRLLEEKAREEADVHKRGVRAIRAGSLSLEEVWAELRVHGVRSVARIAKDLGLTREVAASYVKWLEDAGKVELENSTRRSRDTARVRVRQQAARPQRHELRAAGAC